MVTLIVRSEGVRSIDLERLVELFSRCDACESSVDETVLPVR